MRNSTLIYALVLAWLLVVAWSFWGSFLIEGPRNLDTGFKRLDVFVRVQIIALFLAIISAVLGFIYRREGRRLWIIGLMPIGFTVLAIAGLFLAASLFNKAPEENLQTVTPPKATQPIDQ